MVSQRDAYVRSVDNKYSEKIGPSAKLYFIYLDINCLLKSFLKHFKKIFRLVHPDSALPYWKIHDNRTRGQQLFAKTKMAGTCRCLRVFKFPVRSLLLRTFCSHESPESNHNIPSFDNEKVQTILKKITGRNLDRIFAARKQNLDVPSYKLMTDEEYLGVRYLPFWVIIRNSQIFERFTCKLLELILY